MMLTSDLCLAYKNNPGYDECMVRERRAGNRKNSEKKCRGEVAGKSFDLDPKREQCCSWVCVSTLQKTRILNFKRDWTRVEDYCGWDLKQKAKGNSKLCCSGMLEKDRYPKEGWKWDRKRPMIRDCDAYQ